MSKRLAAISIAALAAGVLVATGSSGTAAPDSALDATLGAHLSDVRASAGEAYKVYRSTVDNNGTKHVRYTRTLNGLRVYGGDFVIHTGRDGAYKGASNALSAPLTIGTTASVPAAAAQEQAKAKFSGTITQVVGSELFVDASSGVGRLAWETTVNGWAPDGQTPSYLHVITDAVSGAYIGKFDRIHTVNGTGNSVYAGQVTIDTTLSGGSYTLTDPSHGNGRTCDMNNGTSTCSNFTDADNIWGNGQASNEQSAAVDAHYGAALTFDYFKNVHNRNGIFGNGQGVPSRVHYGNNYVNAFWDGSQMTYGDGSGNTEPLVSIDVAGHEMSHGVTEAVVSGGLTYSGESGGLNEATSDIFGNMVEFYAGNTNDPGDYDVGEKIDINGNGTPLRYMYNPGLDGSSHTCWSTSTKNVDVHYSSGPANHFFFNLSEGNGSTPYGTSPACGSNPTVTSPIGRAKAEKIWFKALNDYFTSNTSYVNTSNPANTSRAYTLTAAADLYGNCSAEYKAVQAAWTSVNVAGSDTACPVGNDFSVTLSPASGSVNPGSSLTATVNTAVTNGSAQTVNLSASGAPAGVSVSFSPSSVTSGNSSTMTIATTSSAAAGTYTITVSGAGASVTRTATYSLTVNGAPGCSGTNPTDVAIGDNTTVESAITISGCAGNAGAGSTVAVNIVHTYIGDLKVDLVAPDGSVYVLHNHTGGSADNINQTYTVNLSGEASNGTWKLRVNDNAGGDVGKIDTWTLNLAGGPPPGCTGTNGNDVQIPDNTTVESSIVLSGCSGNASSTSTVEVHIVHTYRGDLVVSLVAPDGTVYTLLSRSGGSADNVDQTFTTNLSSEVKNGTWKLRVQDAASQDTGYINSWTLTL